MRNFSTFLKFLVGGILILIGLGVFLYPNYREWKTQQEVESIIDSFTEDNSLTETTVSETDQPADTTQTDAPETEEPESMSSDGQNPTGMDMTETKTQETETAETEDQDDVTVAKADYSKYPELYQALVTYNQELATNGQQISDAFNYEQTPVEFPDLDMDNPVIGYIEIPDMGIRLPLYIGASTENLGKGAAVLSGTSMPVGGTNTNCVIAAHRGWHGSAYFQYIQDLGPGSKIYISTPWETLVYQYRNYKIIDPDDISSILIQEGKDMITLFTCHPYQVGGGPERYLVFCDRVDTQATTIENDEVVNPKTEETTAQDAESETTSEPTSNAETETDSQVTSPVVITEAAQERNGSAATDGIDLLALEQTLRIILPAIVIAFALVMLLIRLVSRRRETKARNKASHKKQKKTTNKTKKI